MDITTKVQSCVQEQEFLDQSEKAAEKYGGETLDYRCFFAYRVALEQLGQGLFPPNNPEAIDLVVATYNLSFVEVLERQARASNAMSVYYGED